MGKNKKSRRKQREQGQVVDDEATQADGEPSMNGSAQPWNTDDVCFDRNGRLVVKNAALARAINIAVFKQGGIVVHAPFPLPEPIPAPPPVPNPEPRPKGPVPPTPGLICPDLICDMHLVARARPFGDPPRDPGFERPATRF